MQKVNSMPILWYYTMPLQKASSDEYLFHGTKCKFYICDPFGRILLERDVPASFVLEDEQGVLLVDFAVAGDVGVGGIDAGRRAHTVLQNSHRIRKANASAVVRITGNANSR